MSSQLSSMFSFSISLNIHTRCASDDDPQMRKDGSYDTDYEVKKLSIKDDELVEDAKLSIKDDQFVQDVKIIMNILRGLPVEVKNKIEQCGVKVTQVLVLEVLSRVRNNWEASFTFFLWAGRQPGYSHSIREYHSMISILGKMRKFDTAWSLIDEMRGAQTSVTPQTLLIIIRKYCAVHDVGRAIHTFYAFKRFKLEAGMDEFQGLLSALCRYKNVQDAEHLMFCNKHAFPFNTKSFNIVLNGWSNVIGSPREAERVWREMRKRGIPYDVVSYASIISCYSKTGNLYRVLKLFDRMKSVGIEPDRKVYNAVIHALAKGRHVKEAFKLVETMEEKGIAPNAVTYNSLIKPLCRAKKIDEARQVFDDMLHHGLPPNIKTYHPFLRMLRTEDEVFALLDKMRKMNCWPTNDTYIMLIRKFCRCRQLDSALKLWNEMSENGISPDRSSYLVLIHGLFLNGKLDEAYKYNKEMKENHYLPEPKMEEILQTWLSNKEMVNYQTKEPNGNPEIGKQIKPIYKNANHEKYFLRQAESRRVSR
ncbi:hypothetical protein K2173_026880 [Erythroxylum novogranatense]|uniref:Pentatricopeptide repeat-containing protein n=1 Tax=Erythroxylum novogranatense TaxID=1862640 RepID=A0AAV8TXT9_9ROSI|nr:hypothetical protein K2173_026880 [Erythroxylum novogranatense]